MSEKAHSWLCGSYSSSTWFALTFSLLRDGRRFSRWKRETLWEPTRTEKCLSWSSGSQGSSHFTVGTNSRGTTPPSLGPDNTPPVKQGWGRSPLAFMDDPLILCLLHCVGQAGYKEQQRQQVAIQSEAFLELSCICVYQIAALHLACKMTIAAEALNEGGTLRFQ